MKLAHRLFLIALTCATFTPLLAKQNSPNVLLAQKYKTGVDVQQYLVSEKFDGVRAIWDGKTFYTRRGDTKNKPFQRNIL